MSNLLIVQTGSVPALLWLLRRHAEENPRVVALDAENVRQYLREIPGLDVRYFRDSSHAERILNDCADCERILYLGGSSFPVLRRTVCKLFKAAEVTPEQSPDWPAFMEDFNRNVRRDSVLLIQTAGAPLIEDYFNNVFQGHGLVRPSINLLCYEEELPRWKDRRPDWRCWSVESAGSLVALARELRRQKFDISIAFFTGNRNFNRLKPLLLASGARQKIVVNEHMQFLPARWTSLLYLQWQSMRHRWDGRELDHTATRVLFIQTWDTERALAVFRRLQMISPFYKPAYTVLARQDHASAFSRVPGVEEILTYKPTSDLRSQLRTLREIRDRRFDGAVVTFTEEPTFRKLKLLPFIIPVRYKLVFNRNYDCFFFTPSSFLKYIRRLCANVFWKLRAPVGREENRVLIVQTWDDDRMGEMLERLPQIRPFYKPRYCLLAREDKVALFSRHASIEEFITYPRAGRAADYWKCLREVRRRNFDAAVLALTEQPTYRKWKWMPFLAGIPSNLIFNRHSDCFFFTPSKFLQYWFSRYLDDFSAAQAPFAALRAVCLPLIRGILFPARFLYLVTSVTLRKLARAYNSSRLIN